MDVSKLDTLTKILESEEDIQITKQRFSCDYLTSEHKGIFFQRAGLYLAVTSTRAQIFDLLTLEKLQDCIYGDGSSDDKPICINDENRGLSIRIHVLFSQGSYLQFDLTKTLPLQDKDTIEPL